MAQYWKAFSPEDKAIKLAPFIAAGHLHCRKNKNTKIEQRAYTVLKQLTDIQQNHRIDSTSFYVDFVSQSYMLIVECYGDYWHCNPTVYKDIFYNKSLHMTAEEKWQKDAKRIKILGELGYTVVIVWESDDIENILKEYLYGHYGIRRAE